MYIRYHYTKTKIGFGIYLTILLLPNVPEMSGSHCRVSSLSPAWLVMQCCRTRLLQELLKKRNIIPYCTCLQCIGVGYWGEWRMYSWCYLERSMFNISKTYSYIKICSIDQKSDSSPAALLLIPLLNITLYIILYILYNISIRLMLGLCWLYLLQPGFCPWSVFHVGGNLGLAQSM